MGRGRDFRGNQRRGFDNDMFSDRGSGGFSQDRGFSGGGGFSRAPEMPVSGTPVDATVKWFNPEKGFGFAEIADGSGDAFLHIAAVQAVGRDTLLPGTTLSVYVGQGQKGRQITRVLSVDDSTAEAPRRPMGGGPGGPRMGGGGGRGPSLDTSNAVSLSGTVKWFSTDKGMGFVEVGDGGKDVFVHISVVQRSQMNGLAEGQRVSMRVVETPKGRQAVSISPA